MGAGIPIHGGVLVELRHLRCMSQEQLASACRRLERGGVDMTREEVSGYERGRRRPIAENLNAVRLALGLSNVEMRALVSTPMLDLRLVQCGGEGGNTDRRSAGRTLAAGLAVAFAPSEVMERVTAAAEGSGSVGAGLLSAHECVASALTDQFGVRHCDLQLALADRHASLLLELLSRPMGASERRRLDALAVGAHVYAAVTAEKTRRRAAGRGYYALARDIADDSGDVTLQAQARAVSVGPAMPWALQDGRPQDPSRAYEALSAALGLARNAGAGTRAWLHRWAGLACAMMGDERGFQLHAQEADSAVAEAPVVERPSFLDMYAANEGRETGATEGMGFMALGRADLAEASLARAFRVTPPGRHGRRAMLLVDRGAVRVSQEEPEQACADLTESLSLQKKTGDARTVVRALTVRAGFLPAWAPLACVRDLDERLKPVSAGWEQA